jgi:hypothetical protein
MNSQLANPPGQRKDRMSNYKAMVVRVVGGCVFLWSLYHFVCKHCYSI